MDLEDLVLECDMKVREKIDDRKYLSEPDYTGMYGDFYYSNNMDLSEGEEEYDLSKYEAEPLPVFRACPPSSDDEEEEQISEVSGTRMNTQLISYGNEFADGQKTDMGIKDGISAKRNSKKKMLMEEDKSAVINSIEGDASEEDLSTDMKNKMEKRKSQEDGVESEQNEGAKTAIEVKKPKNK